jgi:hypothetical protein
VAGGQRDASDRRRAATACVGEPLRTCGLASKASDADGATVANLRQQIEQAG